MKPGFKSTEFWLSLVATIVSALMASDLFGPSSGATKILAFAAAVLAALGYTAARTFVKVAEAKKEAALGAAKKG